MKSFEDRVREIRYPHDQLRFAAKVPGFFEGMKWMRDEAMLVAAEADKQLEIYREFTRNVCEELDDDQA